MPTLFWCSMFRILPRWLASICCYVITVLSCHANSRFLIDVWTPYDGLPQSHVMSITQTPEGYLWVATQLGWLARFDGVRFTHFNSVNTPALVSPEIHKLLVDDQGTLWIADIDGRLMSFSGGKFQSPLTGEPIGREISDKMCVSINTEKTHIRHIYQKLHIRSRSEILMRHRTSWRMAHSR